MYIVFTVDVVEIQSIIENSGFYILLEKWLLSSSLTRNPPKPNRVVFTL